MKGDAQNTLFTTLIQSILQLVEEYLHGFYFLVTIFEKRSPVLLCYLLHIFDYHKKKETVLVLTRT